MKNIKNRLCLFYIHEALWVVYMHIIQDEPYHQVFLLRVHTVIRALFPQNGIKIENAPFSMGTNTKLLIPYAQLRKYVYFTKSFQ